MVLKVISQMRNIIRKYLMSIWMVYIISMIGANLSYKPRKKLILITIKKIPKHSRILMNSMPLSFMSVSFLMMIFINIMTLNCAPMIIIKILTQF
mgnify:CR=1 FL=1